MPRRTKSASAGRRSSGTRPSSKVTIYRRDDRDGIWLERAWVTTDSGRPRAELLEGEDGRELTWEEAELLMKEVALQRERRILTGQSADAPKAEKPPAELSELLAEYHDPDRNKRAGKWSDKHRASQERWRRFWSHALGPDCIVEELSHADVEGKAAKAARALGWKAGTERHALKYIKAVSRFGVRKIRRLRYDPLAGIDIPEPEPSVTAETLYFEDHEAALLVAPDPRIDWRVTLACSIAWDTGRRLRAILHVWVGDGAAPPDFEIMAVKLAGGELVERMFLHFRPEFDKKSRDRWIPVSEETRALIERALEEDAVRDSGWLFPEGRLDHADARHKPIGESSMNRKLRQAEDVLGIEHLRDRGYHGLKRQHLTVSDEESGGDLGLVGDITGNTDRKVMLRSYRRAQARRMIPQVDAVRARLLGLKTDRNTDHA